MHELSIMENTMKIILEKANENKLKTITKVTLKIGELCGVMDDSLNFAFEICRKDTLAFGSELCINKIKAIAFCESCMIKYKIDHYHKLCPNCLKPSFKIINGYEMYIDSIEGDKYYE
jgi:hydrogenase nickel incorporation protein HypA/HybF